MCLYNNKEKHFYIYFERTKLRNYTASILKNKIIVFTFNIVASLIYYYTYIYMRVYDQKIIIRRNSGGVVPGTFRQVEVNSDGRCFFASVWLGSLVDNVDQIAAFKSRIDTFNIIPPVSKNELNTWMQDNVINKLNGIQKTCRFAAYVRLYHLQNNPIMVDDPDLERAIPNDIMLACSQNFNGHNNWYIEQERENLRNRMRTTKYLTFKDTFVNKYQSLNKFISTKHPYAYAEPSAGLAQELANSLHQNIILVSHDYVTYDPIYWFDMRENNSQKTIYICKLDGDHYQVLIPDIPGKPVIVSRPPLLAKTTVEAGEAASLKKAEADSIKSEAIRQASRNRESEDLAAGVKASLESREEEEQTREEAVALDKKKEDEEFLATLKASLAAVAREGARNDALKVKAKKLPKVVPTTVLSPVVSATSVPPLKCNKLKTKIPIYYVVFTGSNKLGDYGYMIKQPEYQNTLFIFNDNEVDHRTIKAGGGNAVIRPYNFYGWFKIKGLTKPLSAGISTGDGKSNKGYQLLDKDTLHDINLRVNDIRSTLLTEFTYDQIIYSGTNNQNPKFKGDPEDLIGIGIFDVNKNVREYITQEIKCLGDFRGKLPTITTITPLQNIKNAAIMLFVNNSANVVFVRAVKDGLWMLPGGQIDNYETPWAAAAREFREETGETLPAGLKETDFKPYDYKHNKNYTRIFIGKTKTDCPTFNKAKIKNKETDKLECRPLSDVIRNKSNYSPNIFNSTNVIYKLINENYENFKNYANLENPGKTNVTPGSIVVNAAAAAAAPGSIVVNTAAPGSIVVNTAAPGSIVTAPGSKKNVTFSSIQKTTNKPEDVQYGHVSGAENEIQRRYVMAANSLKKLNDAPFTSNPKQHIAMGTGAGLAALAGLATGLVFAGGRKNTHTRKKKKQKRARTRKHSRKTLSGFSLNRRRTVKKCYKTQKKRK